MLRQNKTVETDRNICCLQQKGKKKMIYTSCWPWQSIGCDDHNLRVTVWYMGMYSLIHLFHASIYPHPHLVSVFALNLFLDYLNQLPLAPVKHRLAQVAPSRLSDLDSRITASLWVRGGGKKTHFYLLGVETAASACKLWTFVTEQYITDQMVWNQRRERVSINPTKTPFKVLSVLWSLCGLMCRGEISSSWESGCLPGAFVWAKAWLEPRRARPSQSLMVRRNLEPVTLPSLSSSLCHETTARLQEKTTVTVATKSLLL